MNFLVLHEHEWRSPTDVLKIQGERAAYLIATHALEVDKTVPCVLLGAARRGRATVSYQSKDSVHLRVEQAEELLPLPIVAIVAVARPPTLRRIFFQSAMLGLTELHLVRAERLEKSYLQSKALNVDAIEVEMRSGIEQSGSCHLPKVQIHDRFLRIKELVQENSQQWGSKFVADVGPYCVELAAPRPAEVKPVVFAVGPERGWSDFEKEIFDQLGFAKVSLGPRVLRVDTALVSLCGVFQHLLR